MPARKSRPTPPFLAGNKILQRRYEQELAQLRRGGCGNCDTSELDRKYHRLATSRRRGTP